ncbi:MAG: hypothetical protein LBJ87_10500 [bacterium]|jgi:lysylphosphatidylglycerol synthetase-like protein (DUF2156 family)|nr:hypothetical protein [bacterium]
MSFEVVLQSWRDFYVISGGAAAALAGLLFVGLSLHLRTVISESEVRGLARVTLTNFTLILLVALLLVVPESRPGRTGFELLAVGATTLALTLPQIVTGVRRRRTLPLSLVLYRFALSGLTYAGLLAVGTLFLAGDYGNGLGWLVGVVLVLFSISIRNAWDLLVTVGQATTGHDRDPEQRR